MADSQENPLNKLENPVVYIGGAVIAVVASLLDWIDDTFLIFILPLAAFGMYRWYKKKNG